MASGRLVCLNTRWKVVCEQRTGEQGAQRFSADAIMNRQGKTASPCISQNDGDRRWVVEVKLLRLCRIDADGVAPEEWPKESADQWGDGL
jgi:hypothetical protein